jgi:hypothetical protein
MSVKNVNSSFFFVSSSYITHVLSGTCWPSMADATLREYCQYTPNTISIWWQEKKYCQSRQSSFFCVLLLILFSIYANMTNVVSRPNGIFTVSMNCVRAHLKRIPTRDLQDEQTPECLQPCLRHELQHRNTCLLSDIPQLIFWRCALALWTRALSAVLFVWQKIPM